MGIRDDFSQYWDGNGLLAPNPVAPGAIKGSDNGPMFTSEFYAMLKKLGQLTDQDRADFQQKIGQCVNAQGMLCRVPIGQDDGQEQVDDYFGTLNGCMQVGNTKIPRQYLWGMIAYLGSMDNENPGAWQWAAFMPRQLQLVACIIATSFPSWKNPFHILVRALCAPFFLYSAIIIATSCIGTDPSNTDARRLSWHLWQCLKPVSGLCWLASRLWLNRLKGTYGADEMKAVAGIYYQPHPDNPYSKWWITD